jgi:hypothetical protein
MNFKKTMFALAVGSVGIMGAMSAHAVALNAGDVLTITAGTGTVSSSGAVTVTGGSFFRMVGVNAGLVSQGTDGIVIGAANTAHGDIDADWTFAGLAGYDTVTTAITGSTESGLDMSGWTVNWNGETISMAGTAWGAGYTDNIANFTWDGTDGGAYTLGYHVTIAGATGGAAGFNGVNYNLQLQGFVQQAAAPVPEASTYGMMLAGLGLVGFAVRRRKTI